MSAVAFGSPQGGAFGRRRGIFGMMDMPETLPDMAQIPTTAGGAYGDPMAMQPQRKAGLGTRLLGQGWEGKVAALGSALTGNGNAIPDYMQGQQILQARAAQQAEAQRAEAERLAALQRLGYTPDQIVALGGKIGEVQADRMKPQDGPKPGSFEWWSDPARTAEEKAAFTQFQDVTNPILTTTWQGPTTIPRRPPVGSKVNISDLGGAPQPSAPQPNNTRPAPITGARTISRAEYQRILASLGGDQSLMNVWMRNNNVIAGN